MSSSMQEQILSIWCPCSIKEIFSVPPCSPRNRARFAFVGKMKYWPDKSPVNGIDVDANAAKLRGEQGLKERAVEEGFGNCTTNVI